MIVFFMLFCYNNQPLRGFIMGIRSMITKLFKKDISKTAIINLDEIIKLPNRSDINDESLLSKIDKCKDEYTELLKTKGYILPNLLSSSELRDEMSMNIDLIVKQYLSDEEIPNDKLTLITKYLKIKLYLEKLDELGNDVLTRLIALKEISDEKIIFSKYKRHRITYEINSLLSIMIMFNSQRNALVKENSIYHDKLLSLDNGLSLSKDEINIINKKPKDVIELVNFAHPEINTSEYDGLSGLVALERTLEIYVYKHKNTLDIVKSNFKRFNTFIFTNNTNKVINNVEDEKLLGLLKEYELQFRLFNEYGRNLITDEELSDLYRIKFKVLTRKFYSEDYDIELITNNTTDKELGCYKTIVSEMIEDIVKGNTFNIEAYDGSDIFTKRKAINYMIKLLKNGEETFDAEKILYSNFLLNLLLAFTNQKYLPSFFSNYKVYYPIHNDFITWDKYLPLDTIFIINDIYKRSANSTDDSYELSDEMMALKGLYSMVRHNIKYDLLTAKNEHEANVLLAFGRDFYLPEGIKSISTVGSKNIEDMIFYDALIKNATNSIVVFPSTLKNVEGYVFSVYDRQKQINKIKLNDGLEELDLKIFMNQKADSIFIPSSVSKINLDIVNHKNLTICFVDFKESKILNDANELINLFKIFMFVPHQRDIDLFIYNLVLSDFKTVATYVIHLNEIRTMIMKKWETMEYWEPSSVIDYAVLLFKETVHFKTGYMLGGYDNMPLDNVDEEMLSLYQKKH